MQKSKLQQVNAPSTTNVAHDKLDGQKKRKGLESMDPVDKVIASDMLQLYRTNGHPSVTLDQVSSFLEGHIGREKTAYRIVKDSLLLGLPAPSDGVISKLLNTYPVNYKDKILQHLKSQDHW